MKRVLVQGATGRIGKFLVSMMQQEEEPLHSNSVDRIAVARFIKDMILSETGINESLGVTN